MNYYKIYTNDTFIGVACSGNFVAYYPKNDLLIGTDETVGQFVEYKDKLYRDTWMKPLPIGHEYDFTSVTVEPISEEEYLALCVSIEKNEEIAIVTQEQQEESIEVIPEMGLEYMRDSKIKEMSRACRVAIESGFDLELRNEIKHFSLDTQDQLNLMSLSILAQTQSLIPYHADGEECIFYTNEEINEIVETANAWRIYHTTYYNSLKKYINALEDIEEIGAIEYGIDIPEEYQTEVLIALS